MCDPRHTFAFIKAGLTEQGSGGEEKDFFPFTGFQLRQNICCQCHGATAAAAATCMGVLGICIKDLNAAVTVSASNINSFFPQQIDQHCLSHASQIPGDDPVIFLRLHMKILQVAFDGICGGRCHAGPHVHGILESIVHDPSGSHAGDVSSAFLIQPQGKGSASCHRPAGRQRSLVPII